MIMLVGLVKKNAIMMVDFASRGSAKKAWSRKRRSSAPPVVRSVRS